MSRPIASRQSFLPLLVFTATFVLATTSLSVRAADSPSAAGAADRRSADIAVSGSNDDGGSVRAIDQLFDNNEELNNGRNDDEAMDIDDQRYMMLFGQRFQDDDDVEEAVDKRRSRATDFRSDLGKRNDNEYDTVKRTPWRMRNSKTFKADLGKRLRPSSSMFRSDLGRRSDPSMALYGRVSDGSLSSVDVSPEAEVDSHEVERRRSMFRSDLGKRSAKSESVRRMFRADLGKRRAQFRHDLG